jgi:HD superfamily phosphohydrolase
VILRDPVHGLISFETPVEQIVVKLLDAREVQRLRRIRCLGAASLAFPGAEHSRFAHAVGSAFVMKRYLDRVRRYSSDIAACDRVDDDAARVALAAALLHDLGHGPFSHTFEAVVPTGVSHEEWTSRILLDPSTDVHRILAEIDPQMVVAVERLVHGHSAVPHLSRAVSGTFDVDRCDYLVRDSHMTGVRYGLLDLDWLLAALRLHLAPGAASASLAVDGEKGLTAVEGFFLARLYMYRQVYLHKAVRAAEAVLRALFRRLGEIGPPDDTPAALAAMLRRDEVEVSAYLELDDCGLEEALRRWSDASDPVLRDLAVRLRERRLFKTLRIRGDVPIEEARARLDAVMRARGVEPSWLGWIDRVEIDAYAEDEALLVVSGGRLVRLLDASPLLRGLSRETFVHYRAIFPPEVRADVRAALADVAERA